MGTLAGAVGSAMLVGIAAGVADRPIFYASLVYSVCLLAMLGSLQPCLQCIRERFSADLIMPRSF
jgi:hypothetical protein